MAAIPKKLVNCIDDCVEEMMEGLQLTYPGSLRLHSSCRKLALSTYKRDGSVSLLSGGGAGHEPFCAGYVGKGMLTASICGTVFSSPPSSHVFEAIQLLSAGNSGSGVLVIIPNYTGDRLNFGLAIEKAQAIGIKVQSITVGEDCAHFSSKEDFAGRRGLCGLVLVFKIAGALSMEGKSLEEIASTLEKVVSSMSTIGVCLSPCSLPGEAPSFSLEEDEIELGVGVHGESGVLRMKICSAKEITSLMLKKISESLDIRPGDGVVILVNNLGSTTQMEQWIILREIQKQLNSQEVNVLRIYAGHVMTSLDMSGIQVCLLKIGKEKEGNDIWINYLDAPTLAPAWPGGIFSIPVINGSSSNFYSSICTVPFMDLEVDFKGSTQLPQVGREGIKLIRDCIEAAVQAIIDAEERINFLDTKCGDADCGTTLRRGAEGIRSKLDTFPLNCPGALMKHLAFACEPCMAGTTGGIYSLLFTTSVTPLLSIDAKSKEEKACQWAKAWGKAWRSGLNGVMRYCGANVGDRTMMDVLDPACTIYESSPKNNKLELLKAVESCLEAAENGCKSTTKMKARVGRASYVDSKHLQEMDAGAYGAFIWIKAIIGVLQNHLTTNED